MNCFILYSKKCQIFILHFLTPKNGCANLLYIMI